MFRAYVLMQVDRACAFAAPSADVRQVRQSCFPRLAWTTVVQVAFFCCRLGYLAWFLFPVLQAAGPADGCTAGQGGLAAFYTAPKSGPRCNLVGCQRRMMMREGGVSVDEAGVSMCDMRCAMRCWVLVSVR